MKSALALTIVTLASLAAAQPRQRVDSVLTSKQQAASLFDPIVESIDVVDVPAEVRDLVLTRIGVRVGETLTVADKQRIGEEIGRVRGGMTFSYTLGTAPGTVKLRIDPSC
jgi:hypothetical protein